MQTSLGHLTYCTNIHSGESWNDHFAKLQEHIPAIKEKVSPLELFGIGLRLANQASIDLQQPEVLQTFKQWLRDNNCYVLTMNGFPYGGFHHTRVKDMVHAPDWLSKDRVDYTIRLAHLLAALLPDNLESGGISTSPLTYRFWHRQENMKEVYKTATLNLLQVVGELIAIKNATGKIIHIDIEPEPDGLLEDGKEFMAWYIQYLIPLGIPFLQSKFGCNEDVAESAIKEHVQLCYDVCHFAVGYEDHHSMIRHIQSHGIKTGKIQISAALKAAMAADPQQRRQTIEAFRQFDEPVYLHQVVAQKEDNSLIRYPDMPEAIADAMNPSVKEWRAHYHVPLFVENYGVLQSTSSEIEQVLAIQRQFPFTSQLEVETYTWEVLPPEMRLPLTESLIRELQWVLDIINR